MDVLCAFVRKDLDKSLMLCLNDGEGCGVDITRSSKTHDPSLRQNSLIARFYSRTRRIQPAYKGYIDFTEHKEDCTLLPAYNLVLAVTDVATIGKVKVESDGCYVYDTIQQKLWDISELGDDLDDDED